MSVEPAAPLRVRGALAPLVPALCCLLLCGGVLDVVPPLRATAAAVLLAALVYGGRLIRLALAIHGRSHTFGPCRGAGFLGTAVVCAGLTVATAAALSAMRLSAMRSGPDARTPTVLATGLIAATALYLLGLLLLPGTTPSPLARLRRFLDGLGVGLLCLFTAWLLLVAPHPAARALPVVIALITCSGLAVTLITSLRAVRYRPAALLCGAGGALCMLGLSTMAVLFLGGGSPYWLPLAGGALVFGPALAWTGARRADVVAEPAEADTRDSTGYPVLLIPAGAAICAAAYHLLTGRRFDDASVALGFLAVTVLAARESFAVVDIRRYAHRMSRQEAHFRSLVSGSSDVTVVLDEDLTVRWQSPAAARQFGLSEQDVLGRSFAALVHPDDAPRIREQVAAIVRHDPGGAERPMLIEARLRDGFGHWRDTESTVSDQRDVPEVDGLVVHVRDVGERRELERTLHRMAFTDQLTGLANRRQLLRGVGAMREVPGQPGAVLVIDLDGFTSVNDVRGHEIGDAVLIEVARRLRDGVDEHDLPGRLSGDEFAVATAGTPVQAYALASRLVTMLSQPYELPGATVHLTASIGLAELHGATSVGDAVSRAHLALRRARQLRRGRIEWYDEVLEAAMLRRMRLEQELPGVVERGELDLVYQPVLDLVEGHTVGTEVLVRWRHPTLGNVAAADFIPVAEDLGMIDEIGEWALARACRQLSTWLRDGRHLWLAVNLAARQLAAPGLVAMVAGVLETHQVPAERLVLEVTEQSLGADTQRAVAQLAGLRALGVRTALAQFGTGSTPLAYLRRLPVDLLKVDRVLFVEPVGRSGPATPIIDVVVGLGRRLGLEIVAEGLESEAHLDLVRTAGCRYGQGYLFGHPVPAEHLEAFLENHRLAR